MAVPPGGVAYLNVSRERPGPGSAPAGAEADGEEGRGPRRADVLVSGRLVALHLKLKKLVDVPHPIKLGNVRALAMGASSAPEADVLGLGGSDAPGTWRLATHDRNTLHVARTDTYPTEGYVSKTHTRHLSCVALDHSGLRVAAGDVSGRILVWTGADMEALTTQHWHAHEVLALCFSRDDQFLLSGGHEEVLMITQLSEGRRSFLPRLGGAIESIVPHPTDPAKYLVSCRNNSILTVNLATMQVEGRIAGIYPFPHASLLTGMARSGNFAQRVGGGSELVAFPAEKNRVQVVDWRRGRTLT